jgi:hypothetical protein
VRSRPYLEPVRASNGEVQDDTLRRLTVKKVNYAKAGTEIMMRWERGRFVLAGSDWKSSLTNAETDKLFLDLLAQFTREGRNVTAKKGTSYAPAEFASHADAKDVSRETLKRSMDRLLKAGKIENLESGSPSRRRSRLVNASTATIEPLATVKEPFS